MGRARPTKEELLAAAGKTLPDLIAPELRVLFCGINPGLYSAAVGHHFARPGNRFWPALHLGGFTPRLLSPWEEGELPSYGGGVTNVVARATATAAEIRREEYASGGERLRDKTLHYRPQVLAILGVAAYRLAFARPRAGLGLQEERIGDTRLWVLPSPSGLNAHFQLPQLAELFRELRSFTESEERGDV